MPAVWTPQFFLRIGVFLLMSASLPAESDPIDIVKIIEIPPKGEVTKCSIEMIFPSGTGRPKGVLLVMDGENQSAERMFQDSEWRDFAAANQLVLCGVEMHSDSSVLREHRGYFDASRGAGEMLLEGLRKAGLEGLSIYAFGFSGGARFVASFVAWKPAVVGAWSAFSAWKWVTPAVSDKLPPGIIACGLLDGMRLGACQAFYQEMRRRHEPLTWVSIEGHGHSRSVPLEDFTRAFFGEVIRGGGPPVSVDWIKETVVYPQVEWEFLLSSSLPDSNLIEPWRVLNTP